MPGITYPYNLCGIKVPGYTTSSTEAEGETLLRYLVTRGVLSSNSNDSNLAFKKQTYKGQGGELQKDPRPAKSCVTSKIMPPRDLQA